MKIIKHSTRFAATLSAALLSVTAMAADIPSGNTVASQLTQRYQSTVTHCGNNRLPAYFCSGVILRGTIASREYVSWSPSPESIKNGGVSFAYLRRDARFSRMPLGYKNGYILHAPAQAPRHTYKTKVLCAFPVNGQSNGRNLKGCGEHNKYPVYSRPCQQQRIFSASQWYRHFKNVYWSPQAHQCGFLIGQEISNSAQSFMEFIKARNVMGTESFHVNNELRVEVWPNEQANNLPIQAFFYTDGGLQAAQYDQFVFHRTTGRLIPIIKIVLPVQPRDNARFLYSPQDQNKYKSARL